MYLFPHYGLFGVIIDFSRAILNDRSRLTHEFGDKYADMFFRYQINQMLITIVKYFPDLIDRYRGPFELLLVNNFQLMFKVFSALDTYVVVTNTMQMIAVDPVFKNKKLKFAHFDKLLSRVANLAEELITTNAVAAAEGRITNPAEIEWPNLVILKKCFTQYVCGGRALSNRIARGDTIIEVFNYNNPLTYDIGEYDTWGPLVSLDKELELRKKHGLPLDQDIQEWLAYKNLDESLRLDAVAEKYREIERNNIRYEWMIT